MFKTVGLILKPNDIESRKVATNLSVFLKKLGVETLLYQQDIRKKAEMIIILGGDGTFVGAARKFIDNQIPLLGVNLGHLGFLTDINVNTMFESIENILSGKYNTEERFMLECSILKNNFVALNDIVVHRSNNLHMINADIYINDIFVNNGSADGLIINTPTGSTAYALSSGGPIINIGVEAISLVYISPHAMTYRPFIFSANDEVRIHLKKPQNGAHIIFDGQITIPLKANQDIFIKKHHKKLHLIHPSDYNFFDILRNKLNWNQ